MDVNGDLKGYYVCAMNKMDVGYILQELRVEASKSECSLICHACFVVFINLMFFYVSSNIYFYICLFFSFKLIS